MFRAVLTFAVLVGITSQAWCQTAPTTDRPPSVPGTTQPPIGGQVMPGTQPPIAPTTPPAAEPEKIDPVIKTSLESWEKRMRDSRNFYSKGTIKSTNMITKKATERSFDVMCMKPNFARMRLETKPAAGGKPDPNDYTAYICDGKSVYEYDGMTKTRTEYKLRGNGNLLLDFISGAMTADAALKRFSIKLIQNTKHTQHFELRPKTAQDKVEFDAMILVLFKEHVQNVGWLPRTVLMRKNNNQEEEEWNFPQPMVNAEGIKEEAFKPVKAPDGWKTQVKDAPPPPTNNTPTKPVEPRVIRPGTP